MESLGQYELRGELGRGRESVVFRAWDTEQKREVAIKRLWCLMGEPGKVKFRHPNVWCGAPRLRR